MSYQSIGIIAAIVLVIINSDIFRKTKSIHRIPALRNYRAFLIGVFVYYVTDIIWGFLDDKKYMALLYTDTVIYFIAMAMIVVLWSEFVIAYLGHKNRFRKILYYSGRAFLVIAIIVVGINIFKPIIFWFDEEGNYQTGWARYLTFGIQITMFLLTSLYAYFISRKTHGKEKLRHITISALGIVMVFFIALQVHFPLLPIYSVGCMIGTCLLHSFVIEDEKQAYWKELDDALERERQKRIELGEAKRIAYTDPLTGVKSKGAYLEAESQIDSKIASGNAKDLAIAIFDINDLKTVNDTLGHEKGDKFIISGCNLICNHFKHSPVFRIGGDEFVAIIEGQDFTDRDKIKSDFEHAIIKNMHKNDVIVSIGMTDYIPGQDLTLGDMFGRADKQMYSNKQVLKDIGKSKE